MKTGPDLIYLKGPRRLRPVRMVRTMPYPGFPTDAQAPFMALSTLAQGTSVFVENIFESRYKHAAELMRMGARIKVEGRVAVVEGVPALHSAQVRWHRSAGRRRSGASPRWRRQGSVGSATSHTSNGATNGWKNTYLASAQKSQGSRIGT